MERDTVWFDCNVALGRPQTGCYAPATAAPELLEQLDWMGVDRALVRHVLQQSQSPVVGNRILGEALADDDSGRLLPAWAILPPQTGELGTVSAFFAAMAANDVRSLWAFPLDHRYMLNRLTFGAFLDEVAERRVPLFFARHAGDAQPQEAYGMITALLAEYPTLRLVLTGTGSWGEDRLFRPLLDAYPGFHVGISHYELDCGLRDLVAYCGADRLLYGSDFPTQSMGGPRMTVATAEIDDDAKRAIAGGNLARLIEEVQL